MSCLLFSGTLMVAAPAGAEASAEPKRDTPAAAPLAATSQREKLDLLFADLRRTRDPAAAGGIVTDIRRVWADSGSPTINLLMLWASDARKAKKYSNALDYLDEAIALKPDYVEAWNQRATLHYEAGNYDKSMSDIARVLTLEPRHFGALSGMAGILEESGKDADALAVWGKVLEVYPADHESQDHVKTLAEKLSGSKT